MRGGMKAVLWITVALLLTIGVDGRGGRGGGRGGSRGSNFKPGKRFTVGSRYYVSYSGAVKAGFVVHGMARYQNIYRSSKLYKTDPDVCYANRSSVLHNGTRVASLGYFVCPYNDLDTLSDTYCCGPQDRQSCCDFWESPKRAAGKIMTIIGCTIFAALFLYGLVRLFWDSIWSCLSRFCRRCCKCCHRSRERQDSPPHAYITNRKTKAREYVTVSTTETAAEHTEDSVTHDPLETSV